MLVLETVLRIRREHASGMAFILLATLAALRHGGGDATAG
jgi:hypothetical protein